MIRNKHLLLAALLMSVGIYSVCEMCEPLLSKLSEEKKKPIEVALDELKKAHESKDLQAIDKALESINEAWKNASEEMYKAQSEKGSADAKNTNSQEDQKTEKSGDDVQDVDFEEVKD